MRTIPIACAFGMAASESLSSVKSGDLSLLVLLRFCSMRELLLSSDLARPAGLSFCHSADRKCDCRFVDRTARPSGDVGSFTIEGSVDIVSGWLLDRGFSVIPAIKSGVPGRDRDTADRSCLVLD